MRLEDELLVNCARLKPSKEVKVRMREIVKENLDWAYFFKKSMRHGVEGMAYLNLKDIGLENQALLEKMRIYYLGTSLQNKLFIGWLEKILSSANKKNLPVMVIKGPCAIKKIYKDFGCRWLSDLDLFVKPPDFRLMEEILLQHGFKRRKPTDISANIFENRLYEEGDFKNTPLYHIGYTHPDKVIVELHWRFFQPRKRMAFDEQELWDKVETVNFGQSLALTLNNEDVLWYLCLQLAMKAFSGRRLKSLMDINELILASKIDWQVIVKRAKKTKTDHYLYASLKLAKDLFQTPVPQEIFEELKPPLAYRLTYSLLNRHFLALEQTPKPIARNLARFFRFVPFSTPL